MKVKVPKKTPKIQIPSNGVINEDGVLKSSHRPKGDHVAHFKNWIERPIARN